MHITVEQKVFCFFQIDELETEFEMKATSHDDDHQLLFKQQTTNKETRRKNAHDWRQEL